MPFSIDPQSLVSSINWQQPNWDVVAIAFLLVAAFVYGFSLGRDRIILNIISIYISLTLVDNLPLLTLRPFAGIPENQHFIVRISAFMLILMILFFLFTRSAFFSSSLRIESAPWWQVLALSIFQVGLLISVALSFLPSDILSSVSPLTQQIFASGQAHSFWLIAAILAALITRESRDSSIGRFS